MTLRARLDEIVAGSRLLREIRYYTDDQLADITDDDLELAARWLMAASYSALEGARRLTRHHQQRTEPCSKSDPNTTARNGNTDGAPTDAPPTKAPASPSDPTPSPAPTSS